jgi:adenine-specific DNA methylase
MGYHYRNSTERIMFFEKGKRNLNYMDVPDVLHHEAVHNGWPTEKPVSLMKVLIEQSVDITASPVVLDPFCGSGSVGVAAVQMGCTFLGNDIDPQAAAIASARIQRLFTNQSLDPISHDQMFKNEAQEQCPRNEQEESEILNGLATDLEEYVNGGAGAAPEQDSGP